MLPTGIISTSMESCAVNNYTSHCYAKLMLIGESLTESEIGTDFGFLFQTLSLSDSLW